MKYEEVTSEARERTRSAKTTKKKSVSYKKYPVKTGHKRAAR